MLTLCVSRLGRGTEDWRRCHVLSHRCIWGLWNALWKPSWSFGHLGALEDQLWATEVGTSQHERPEAGKPSNTLVIHCFSLLACPECRLEAILELLKVTVAL